MAIDVSGVEEEEFGEASAAAVGCVVAAIDLCARRCEGEQAVVLFAQPRGDSMQ